ncbi:MAG: hypothetical protein PHY28_07005 [Dehalococcoidales bacterium]|nr:hypothetical protein [Dehalococcoidales bacterium]
MDKQKAQKQLLLGLVRLDQWEDYNSIIPELAARQARGIIMVHVSLRLSRLIQFGTLKLQYLYYFDFTHYRIIHFYLSNILTKLHLDWYAIG